jgi:hypothetical protein
MSDLVHLHTSSSDQTVDVAIEHAKRRVSWIMAQLRVFASSHKLVFEDPALASLLWEERRATQIV